VHQKVLSSGVSRFGVKIHRAGEYPTRLRDARNPVELLYHRGEWELTETRSVAIVGARKATDDGKRRAQRLARLLVEANFTIASGLAEGIDTAAHEAALHAKGRTIAVVGTPIHTVYPRQNASLQERIAAEHLVISQVPVLKYDQQTYRENRSFFPERNATMSALTEATVIVEASDTSGTLIQARAALYQGRKVFILDSCFKRTDIRWPSEFEKKGAVRVRDIEDVVNTLG
jgi:DNA processing protein